MEKLMNYASTIVMALALATGMFTQQGKESTGAAALQGTWSIASINGQSPQDGAAPLTLSFDGDKYSQAVGTDVNERGSFKVDSAKKPMTIDLTIMEGDDAGKTQLGIVEVDGDKVQICFAMPGATERPADFTAKEGVLMVLGTRKK
jgi:uncharacterized protein (TIGR03067 family)